MSPTRTWRIDTNENLETLSKRQLSIPVILPLERWLPTTIESSVAFECVSGKRLGEHVGFLEMSLDLINFNLFWFQPISKPMELDGKELRTGSLTTGFPVLGCPHGQLF
jgi:hypothetical protein